MLQPLFHNATMKIDLQALTRNWQRLAGLVGAAETGAAIKANAYGMGAEHVAAALHDAGCRTFFVANANEGSAVHRGIAAGSDSIADINQAQMEAWPRVYVLNGVRPGGGFDLIANNMRPILNDLGAIEYWRQVAADKGAVLPCAIHIDTGMTRLGLLGSDIERLKADPSLLEGLDIDFWLTHLACADEIDHPMNRAQLDLFKDRIKGLPTAPLSIANSAGVFLGQDWHLDLCRPGIALYGSNPVPNDGSPMEEVLQVSARILQVHEIRRERHIGYGATHTVAPGTRIATCGMGYADGYLRSLSGRGYGMVAGHRVPLVGRVSMDLITFDVTSLPEHVLQHTNEISIIGGGVDIDELAASGGTIAYELLTGLGQRFARQYV